VITVRVRIAGQAHAPIHVIVADPTAMANRVVAATPVLIGTRSFTCAVAIVLADLLRNAMLHDVAFGAR
jgi:hypothetical protein